MLIGFKKIEMYIFLKSKVSVAVPPKVLRDLGSCQASKRVEPSSSCCRMAHGTAAITLKVHGQWRSGKGWSTAVL